MKGEWPAELEEVDVEIQDAHFREVLRMARALAREIEGLVRARGLDVDPDEEEEVSHG